MLLDQNKGQSFHLLLKCLDLKKEVISTILRKEVSAEGNKIPNQERVSTYVSAPYSRLKEI